MNKNINKSKLYMIISISLLCISILGTSIAYYRKVLFNTDASTITYGLDYYINYAKGQDISGTELLPTEDYVNGTSSDIELWKKDNTYDIYGHIYLDINEIGSKLSESSAVKYTLENNGYSIAEGTITGSEGDSILVAAIPLQTKKQLYKIYIWLDTNENPSTELESEVLSLTVRCEATMKPTDTKVNLLYHINTLYTNADKTAVTNNGIAYNYATSASLMNDRLGDSTVDADGGNIRYYGANPNNYIYFNCSDYYNQSSTTCETWRIIGIVDGKVKLIRSESIGDYVWDDNGTNNWKTSTLNAYLNGDYYSSLKTKNNKTIGLISQSTYYLGGYDTSEVYSNEIYKYERRNEEGTTIYSGNSFTVETNIGLMYASDYGYGVDFNKCSNALTYSDTDECYASNDWLYNHEQEWLITQVSGASDSVWILYNDSSVSTPIDNVHISEETRPVLYLNSELSIESEHEGTSTDPYRINVS